MEQISNSQSQGVSIISHKEPENSEKLKTCKNQPLSSKYAPPGLLTLKAIEQSYAWQNHPMHFIDKYDVGQVTLALLRRANFYVRKMTFRNGKEITWATGCGYEDEAALVAARLCRDLAAGGNSRVSDYI